MNDVPFWIAYGKVLESKETRQFYRDVARRHGAEVEAIIKESSATAGLFDLTESKQRGLTIARAELEVATKSKIAAEKNFTKKKGDFIDTFGDRARKILET